MPTTQLDQPRSEAAHHRRPPHPRRHRAPARRQPQPRPRERLRHRGPGRRRRRTGARPRHRAVPPHRRDRAVARLERRHRAPRPGGARPHRRPALERARGDPVPAVVGHLPRSPQGVPRPRVPLGRGLPLQEGPDPEPDAHRPHRAHPHDGRRPRLVEPAHLPQRRRDLARARHPRLLRREGARHHPLHEGAVLDARAACGLAAHRCRRWARRMREWARSGGDPWRVARGRCVQCPHCREEAP